MQLTQKAQPIRLSFFFRALALNLYTTIGIVNAINSDTRWYKDKNMIITEIIEKRIEGEIEESKTIEHQLSFKEFAELLQYHLFCGFFSISHVDTQIGSNCDNVWLYQDISEGDRQCIETGCRKLQSFHFGSDNASRDSKYWRRVLALLMEQGRIIY